MDSSNTLYQILTNIAQQLPSLLTMLACIIVALIRWKRHPRVSMLLTTALALIFLHALVFVVVYAILPNLWTVGSFAARRSVFLFVSVVYNLTLAIPTAILIAAVFIKRDEPTRVYSSETT